MMTVLIIPRACSTARLLVLFTCVTFAQSTMSTFTGIVVDANGAVVPGVTVTARNTATGLVFATVTTSEGRYRLDQLPNGLYELKFESVGFAPLLRKGLSLDVNQTATINATLDAGGINEGVTVVENAAPLNTNTAEVITRFDRRRLSELPVSPSRDVLSLLLSSSGVSQLGPGQSTFAAGVSYSSSGSRIRANNFLLDGQDVNDPVFTGTGIALNNPDAIQEIRIVTNQFRADHGRNSGSVVNIVGRSGTNEYRGSLFWYHNNEHLNACSNLDKAVTLGPTGFCDPVALAEDRRRAPKRLENQFGLTLGGPLSILRFGDGGPDIWTGKDRTFFFGDFQRWTDRSLNSGATISGAPTAAGRAVLASVAADRPHVQALLDLVPVGVPNGSFAVFTIPGRSSQLVELGNLTGSVPRRFNDRQGSIRLDHRIGQKNLIWGRYRADSQRTTGSGQVTPPRHSAVNIARWTAVTVVLNSSLTRRIANQARFGWFRYRGANDAQDPVSKSIPSITIPALGMVNAAALGPAQSARTAIGLPPTLPGSRRVKAWQVSDTMTYVSGDHTLKLGGELRGTNTRIIAFQNARGAIQYASPPASPGQPVNISNFVNDTAATASINFPVPGGDPALFFDWKEVYGFLHDEWLVTRTLSLNIGLRYEYSGNSFDYLDEINESILAANGYDPAYRYGGSPRTDKNNLMPRVGFSWNPKTGLAGLLGSVTGGDKLVIRGGYARAYDANFVNINANLYAAFPFLISNNVSLNGAFAAIRTATPVVTNPHRLERFIVDRNFRAPAADQIALNIQRELSMDLAIEIGYVRTRGTGLFQYVDANPCRPGLNCRPPNFGNRVDPNAEVVRLYTNPSASTYDAMQASISKRFSKGFGAGLHYTYSCFIDDASDIFAPSAGELAVAQNPFDRKAERARSSYDRPHRISGNFVFELPFFRRQSGKVGRLLGGWQISSFFAFQSGAPFSVMLGSDPGCAVCGFATSVRANVNTTIDLSRMTIEEVRQAGGADLFSGLPSGHRVGNSGRNILRADGLGLVDVGFAKNTRISDRLQLQFRTDLFNALNSRNFGIPPSSINSVAFLDQWTTDGGSRRIRLAARLVF